MQLIDVRSRAEWLKGHLPGATSLPLLDLDPKKRVIDPSKPSLIYCHEGYRATTAASILLRGEGWRCRHPVRRRGRMVSPRLAVGNAGYRAL